MACSQRPQWQQTMLRIKDPKVSVPFYQTTFGMTLLDEYHFPDMKFSLYFLATIPEGEVYPHTPGTDPAHDYLWNMKGCALELTHNHGSENDADFKVNNGNVEPVRGFGHIAFNTPDVYAVCTEMEAQGIRFQKKPDEGRMKGLAFALDPDGYWLEIVRRPVDVKFTNKYNLSQTMMRIKDPAKSIPFYTQHLGMTVVAERHFQQGNFSLFFLASLAEGEVGPDPKSEGAMEFVKNMFNPVLELTHNHGTENQEGPAYHSGNVDPKGFGHIGFLVDDVDAKCAEMETQGVAFQKKPNDGKMKGLAFALDPDGYWVEIVKRGLKVEVVP